MDEFDSKLFQGVTVEGAGEAWDKTCADYWVALTQSSKLDGRLAN